MMLYVEAEKISLLGMEAYRFGFFVMLGMLAAAAVIGFLSWAKRLRRGTGQVLMILSLVLGGACSRLFYCLLSFEERGTMLPFGYWFRFTGGGWSMMGLVAGVLSAAWLTAKITRQKSGQVMDIAACALPAFMVLERVGEECVPEFDYSRRLTTGLLDNTFLAFSDYDGAYLATNRLAAIVMAILIPILIFDLTRSRKDGDTCLLFLLLFGGCSILLESLRYDQFLTVHSFVGLQHVGAAIMLGIGIFILAGRADRRRKKLALTAAVSVFAMAGLCVGLEFALDRTTFSKLLIYIAYILLISAPVAMGIMLRKASSPKS